MDIGMRVMKQVQVSTSITLVRFLSKSLHDMMNPLDMCMFSVLVLCVTYVVGNEYVLSPLSRRLAVLLMLEKLRPLLATHINDGVIFHVHGLMVNAGFLSIVAVVPPFIKESSEGSMLIQSFIYLYGDVFDFLAQDASLHITLLCLGFVALALFSKLDKKRSSVLDTTIQVGSIAVTYLLLTILQTKYDGLSETSVVQTALIFTLLHFFHLPGMEDVEDYMVYNIAGSVQSYIKSDPWYWCGVLLIVMQAVAAWLTMRSMASQVLLLVIVNLAVATTLTYIQRLAVYDTIITLKTSALVLQFIVHEMSRNLVSSK